MRAFPVYLLWLTYLFTACSSQEHSPKDAPTYYEKGYPLAYDLYKPNVVFELPEVLNEISGLSTYDAQYLVAVQDEIGELFFLDIATAEISQVLKFAANGDYEGVACTAQKGIYVLRSDGVLFRISNWEKNADRIKVDTRSTFLSEVNNTEGLAYDQANNRLLIACKGSAALDKKEREYDKRAFFTFNLNNFSMAEEPTYLLDKNQVKKFLKEHPDKKYGKKMWKRFRKGEGLSLGPSAVAVHPIDKNIYILAAQGNAMIIMDSLNTLVHIQNLPSDLFEQPEGLTFLPNGDLFIASERKREAPKLFRFNWQP